MIGLGYRREMADWEMSTVEADFFEVAPENWLRRDRAPLHRLLASGRAVHLHGVSLNLGGSAPINREFLGCVRRLMDELGTPHYSDHLAASGDAHQLYDLFPVPFTEAEARRVGHRILQVQDILGRRIAIENATWYTNTCDMTETDFIACIVQRADCRLLLDLNNTAVNHKNHGGADLERFVGQIDLSRVSYLHVAGHEFDSRLGLYIDTHSQTVEPSTVQMARRLAQAHGMPILLEWDNDVPDMDTINRELACLQPSLIT